MHFDTGDRAAITQELTEDERIDMAAGEILERFRKAFEELAT